MKKVKVNNGDRYNNITIIKEVFGKHRRYFKIKCECGIKKDMSLDVIKRSYSCGCYKDKLLKDRVLTHWKTWKPLYNVYASIIQRCSNKNNKWYKNYGWRWIKCEWQNFEEFYKDMWESYKEWLSIDRKDNDWNYCKSNCRWATRKMQNRNTRQNRLYKWKCISQWCEELWLIYWTVMMRIYRGATIKKALQFN